MVGGPSGHTQQVHRYERSYSLLVVMPIVTSSAALVTSSKDATRP